MAESVSALLGNAVVIGEFCELDGPVARELHVLRSSYGHRPEPVDVSTSPQPVRAAVEELMTLSMSADYSVVSDGEDNDDSFAAPVSFLLDGLHWGGTTSMAHVTRFNIPDVFARGHRRAVCIAFVSTSVLTALPVSRWAREACEKVAIQLRRGAMSIYVSDLTHCQRAISLLVHHTSNTPLTESSATITTASTNTIPYVGPTPTSPNERWEEVLPQLSSTTQHGLRQEWDSLTRRAARHPPGERSPDATGNGDIHISMTEAVALAERLIAHRGSVALRPLRAVCGPMYDAALDATRHMLWHFSLDPPLLMEGALGTAMSTFSIFQHTLDDATCCGESSFLGAFVFCIGEWPVLAPLHFPAGPFPARTPFTALHDPALFVTLRDFGPSHIIDIANAALQGQPIIICGNDVGCIAAAMKVAAMFVPGLLQGHGPRMRLGLLPLASKDRLHAAHTHHYAVLGCAVEAAIGAAGPFFPHTCVWHVERRTDASDGDGGFRTVRLFADRYGVAKGRTRAASLSSGREAVEGGMLCELAAALQQRTTRTEQCGAHSDATRVMLKRILFDYCALASMVLQSLVRHGGRPETSHLQLWTLAQMQRTAEDRSDNLPWVWCEYDTAHTLRQEYGHATTPHCDLVIITEIVKRMSILAAQHTPKR